MMANKYLVVQHSIELPIGNDRLIKFNRNYTAAEIEKIVSNYPADTWVKDIGWYDNLDDANEAVGSEGKIAASKYKYNNLFYVGIDFVLIDYYTDTGEADPYDEEYDCLSDGFYPEFIQVDEDEEGE